MTTVVVRALEPDAYVCARRRNADGSLSHVARITRIFERFGTTMVELVGHGCRMEVPAEAVVLVGRDDKPFGPCNPDTLTERTSHGRHHR